MTTDQLHKIAAATRQYCCESGEGPCIAVWEDGGFQVSNDGPLAEYQRRWLDHTRPLVTLHLPMGVAQVEFQIDHALELKSYDMDMR